MVIDGLILMVTGMVTVYLFLVLMILIIGRLSSIFRDHALQEEQSMLREIEEKRKKKMAKEKKSAPSAAPIVQDGLEAARMAAVISAAIHAHNSRQG